MIGGVIVVAGVVGALALYETVLPWAFAALRKRRRGQARAKAERERKVEAQLPCSDQGAASSPAQSDTKDSRLASEETPRPPEEPCNPSASSLRQSENESILNERKNAEAQWLWEEARGMRHRFRPDREKDRDYLAKIHDAARLGHLEAMAKLGEYAARRGAIVEAFYWTLLAELHGATGLKVQLRELRTRWKALGCPRQHRNAYEDFTEEQGAFARAVLRLQCGIDPQYARARLKELAERGVEEAQRFLKK